MDTTRTPLPGIPAGPFFGFISLYYILIPKLALEEHSVIFSSARTGGPNDGWSSTAKG